MLRTMTNAAETSLWAELKTVLRLTARIFGAPVDLYEERVLPRREARILRAWIGALETIARALLAVMAVRIDNPNPAPAPRRARARRLNKTIPPQAAADTHAPFTDRSTALVRPYDSDAWSGVVFRVASPTRNGSGGGSGTPRRFHFVRGLTFRLEALIRVAEKPEGCARRLARRLHAQPAIAAGFFRRAKVRCELRSESPPWAELLEEALSLARTALPPETG
jgi:hypothetical protein